MAAKNSTIQLLEGFIALIDAKNLPAKDRWDKLTSMVALSLAGLATTHGMSKQDIEIGLKKIRGAK